MLGVYISEPVFFSESQKAFRCRLAVHTRTITRDRCLGYLADKQGQAQLGSTYLHLGTDVIE